MASPISCTVGHNYDHALIALHKEARPPFFFGRVGEENRLELTRFDGTRQPVRVGYRLREQKLELLLWFGAKVKVYKLLDKVERCDFAFLDQDGNWRKDWPEDYKVLRPRGIRVSMAVSGRGDFERALADRFQSVLDRLNYEE